MASIQSLLLSCALLLLVLRHHSLAAPSSGGKGKNVAAPAALSVLVLAAFGVAIYCCCYSRAGCMPWEGCPCVCCDGCCCRTARYVAIV